MEQTKDERIVELTLSTQSTRIATIIADLEFENKALKLALHNVVDACEDKGGQFRAWHNHLREQTKVAKTLLP
jgi:hypothetical protein